MIAMNNKYELSEDQRNFPGVCWFTLPWRILSVIKYSLGGLDLNYEVKNTFLKKMHKIW
jgi:hypothetical protein